MLWLELTHGRSMNLDQFPDILCNCLRVANSPDGLLRSRVLVCADGLAVGASSLSTDRQLTGLIALAMVLHKMPAAIGLTSYLRSRGWPLQDGLKALLVFASASPLVALACAAVLVSFPGVSSSPQVRFSQPLTGCFCPLVTVGHGCLVGLLSGLTP